MNPSSHKSKKKTKKQKNNDDDDDGDDHNNNHPSTWKRCVAMEIAEHGRLNDLDAWRLSRKHPKDLVWILHWGSEDM